MARRTPAHRTYSTDRITVRWDSTRCIHTARCLNALPRVFDVQARPWVDVDGADPDAIGEAVRTCPTGALRFERLDGGARDEPRRPTVAVPIPDGPLLVMGDVCVEGPDGELLADDPRLTLCRCGRTRNQPFCDNSHLMAGFRSRKFEPRSEAGERPAQAEEESRTVVTATRDGSLHFQGRVVVMTQQGDVLADADDLWLCRCGRSQSKPFCDLSHRGEFESRLVHVEPARSQAESPAAFEPNRHVAPEAHVDPST